MSRVTHQKVHPAQPVVRFGVARPESYRELEFADRIGTLSWLGVTNPRNIEHQTFETPSVFAELARESVLVGLWPCDDGSGSTVTDSTVTENDATLDNGKFNTAEIEVINNPDGVAAGLARPPAGELRADVDGWLPLGHALRCRDGETGTAEPYVANDPAFEFDGEDFTFEMWFLHPEAKAADLPDDYPYLARHYNGGVQGSWLFRLRDTHLELFLYGTTSANKTFSLPATYTGGDNNKEAGCFRFRTWYHVAWTWTKSDESVRVYLNAIKLGNTETLAIGAVANVVTDPLQFGQDSLPGGGVCQARIWRFALPQSHIQARMRRQVIRPTPGLVGNWPMNDNAGTTFVDLSGSGNTGTVNTDSVWGPGPYPQDAAEQLKWMAAL